MADKVLCDKSDLVNIADAVRSKLGVTNTYYVSELSSAIQSIQTGGITPSGTISITENGTVDVSQYANAEVNVAGSGGGGSEWNFAEDPTWIYLN